MDDNATIFFTFVSNICRLERGIVIKSTGSRYRVLYGDNVVIDCYIKGKLRIKELRTTNPVAVGDHVLFDIDEKSGSGIITEVLDRRNYILRKSSNLSKHSQIIAANIDQAFLMVTIILPETPVEFIDRFLISAEAYRIPTIILINKTDLYGESELARMDYLESLYGKIGYQTINLSLYSGTEIEAVKQQMKGKVSLISGNSGVGKSSLLNILNPALNLKTEKISDYHKQGKHITTFPEMHQMPFGGFVIDTPGIRGFGVVDMDRNEIYHFFREIFEVSKDCRFNNCLHLDEPDCAVRAAVQNGKIDPLRYRSYLNITESDNRKYR
ncbi:MAG TPA: ribosome small subunit-dependent GTPase A [Bacteroidales bacterium]|nr:ribosome small subunit-dependent GTPase A [Bacteroidales bacterium]HBH82457.1 ribosome small subunit-dependent GTPase A [Bacteroidales bacterium]HBQ82520.1 ribosome small subunit-dependent GTPase A [Bacteroidales bacterium]HCU18670.1 ribosome small subunit-dependent GTPase A [Bacteroidales bacterium]